MNTYNIRNRKILTSFYFVITAFISLPSLYSQNRFSAEISMGFNFSQLDGDNLQGFNKLGLRSGLWLAGDITKTVFVRTGFLFDQKGSSTGISIGSAINQESIQLNYLSLQLLAGFKEWLYDENNYKIEILTGLNTGYLLSASSSNGYFNSTEDFRSIDLSPTFGVSYRISSLLKFQFMYERSLLKIFKPAGSSLRGLQSFLIYFGAHYIL